MPRRPHIHLAGMINPVHLLLTPPQPQEVPRLIISPGRRYVRYINKTYHRTGTLWDSRYKSSLVQEDTYLTAVPTIRVF
jgi:putative transposase